MRLDRPQQRVAFLLNEQGLLDVLKEAGSVFEGTSLTGLHLQADVQHRNLVTEDPIRSDSLDIYVDAAVAQDLLDFDITTQKFVDDSVIVVDGNRIQVGPRRELGNPQGAGTGPIPTPKERQIMVHDIQHGDTGPIEERRAAKCSRSKEYFECEAQHQ